MDINDILITCFGLAVLIAGGVMTVFHYRRWKHELAKIVEPDQTADHQFYIAQQRRRFQIGLLGSLGGVGLITAGLLFQVNPVGGSIFVCGSVVFVLWAILVAIVDAMSVSVHFNAKHAREIAQQVKLEDKLNEAMREHRKQKKSDNRKDSQ